MVRLRVDRNIKVDRELCTLLFSKYRMRKSTVFTKVAGDRILGDDPVEECGHSIDKCIDRILSKEHFSINNKV